MFVLQLQRTMKNELIKYRGDAAVIHSSAFLTVPHRSQWISVSERELNGHKTMNCSNSIGSCKQE